MTRRAPIEPERVSIADETPGYVAIPRSDRREFVDSTEPGFVRDPFTRKLYATWAALTRWPFRAVPPHVRLRNPSDPADP